MNEPDRPEGMLDEIGEMAHMLAIYAEMMETYANIGDVVGLAYASRKSWAYMKQIRTSVKHLLPEPDAPAPEADRLEPVEPGDDVVPPWIEENGA